MTLELYIWGIVAVSLADIGVLSLLVNLLPHKDEDNA